MQISPVSYGVTVRLSLKLYVGRNFIGACSQILKNFGELIDQENFAFVFEADTGNNHYLSQINSAISSSFPCPYVTGLTCDRKSCDYPEPCPHKVVRSRPV